MFDSTGRLRCFCANSAVPLAEKLITCLVLWTFTVAENPPYSDITFVAQKYRSPFHVISATRPNGTFVITALSCLLFR